MAIEEWRKRGISRRDLLKHVGIAGAVAATPVGISAARAMTALSESAPAQKAAPHAREAFEALTAAEADILEAVVARLIPTDENGPGATEARAAHYIDRALTGMLRSSRAAYTTGLAAIDNHAEKSKGAAFAKLAPTDQDAVLNEVEEEQNGATRDLHSFLDQVRTHTIQGTFCDPYYGGNANFVGWDLIGYPGIRMFVTAEEQRMGVTVPPNHEGAYDHAMFTKWVSNRDD